MNKTQILVVEDDSPIRNLITTTLKTNNYRYLTAVNGESAISQTASHNPDIILLDLGLPDIDGVEVIKKIRTWTNTPIIVISARTEDADKIEALDAGADDYLTKPFSVDELLARLRVTVRRLSLMQTDMTQNTSVFENGDLKIDYAAGCAYLNGEELHLTKIENKGQVSSDILDTYLTTHWIDVVSCRNDNFQEHIIKRAKMLLNAIEKATGKSISGRDSEDVVNAFGGKLS